MAGWAIPPGSAAAPEARPNEPDGTPGIFAGVISMLRGRANRSHWGFGQFPLGVILLGLLAPISRAAGPAPDEFFEKEVRPVLVERCQGCHNDQKHKGGLKLTSRATLLSGGDDGPAAVAGKPEESPIVQAIRYQAELKMPPKGKLNDREVETLTKWVALGLPWPESSAKPIEAAAPGKAYTITEEQRRFWSFQPVRDPAAPEVKDASWPKGDIDRFLLAALEAKGLRPAPPADRRTLLRRATFDLTGLPPTPEEVDAFLHDPAPDAFAKVVERLLASPRYGERWGRHWLDVVRYADSRDSRGIGSPDDITEAWRYRDWVVAAFNRDLPYDKFVRDQLAGDLLPGDGPEGFNAEGMIATGLLAIGEWGTGDADKEKMMTDIADDQIDVVGRAFLGLTLACARCHDHKFDPIPTADYYGLAGIFLSTHILPDPGAKTAGSPMLRTPIAPKATIAAAERHAARIAELEQSIKSAAEARAAALARARLPETSRYMVAAWDLARTPGQAPADFAAARGLRPEVLARWVAYLGLGGDDGRLLARSTANVAGVSGVYGWDGPEDCPNAVINTNDAEQAVTTYRLPPRSVSIHPGPRSAVAVSWTSPIAGVVSVRGKLADGNPGCGDGVGWSLAHRRGGTTTPLAGGEFDNGGMQAIEAGEKLTGVAVAVGDVIRLAVRPRENYFCDTTAVSLTIARVDGPAESWDLAADVAPDPLGGGHGNPHADRLGHPDVWRFTELASDDRSRPDPALAAWDRAALAADRAAIEAAARGVQEAIDREPAGALAKALTSPAGPFRADAAEPDDATKALQAELATLKASPPPPIPVALVAVEGGVPNSAHAGIHDARIHVRGSYQRLGEVVPRHFPRIVAGDEPPSIPAGSGRLELARWLTRPDHPLTARVMVNRIWQHHFGAGLVRTPSNFGKLGEPPTNPDLLDSLARRFVASGWSIKAMHRAVMLSAAYQQSSLAPPETLRADPENRLFGRMNRRRLESEAIRDNLLSASGRLDLAMGGPSYRDFSTPRRTLYSMTIRSDRSSFGPLFDAADATAIVDTRTVSTVAPQSLFLMNHPFALEQARALARRLASEGLKDDEGRIRRAYLLLYSRPPGDDEVAVGRSIVGKLRASGPDERAWAAYCQVLMCTNEFIYVE